MFCSPRRENAGKSCSQSQTTVEKLCKEILLTCGLSPSLRRLADILVQCGSSGWLRNPRAGPRRRKVAELLASGQVGTGAGSPREVPLPRLPRIRIYPIRASGSSGQSFAARRSYSATRPLVQDFSLASCAIQSSFVEMVSEIGI